MQTPRIQLAMDAASRALPDAVGRLYVEKYFPASEKARVQRIVANVIGAFGKRVEALEWMEPATKAQALLKLKTLYFGVGYPERWANYSELRIDARDAVGNLQRVAQWNYRNALANLHRSSAASDWVTAPQAVAAYLIPQQNAYNFAAALLQSPKFDPTAPDAVNYGAIGAICGHEISHFVDLLGADYDARGGMHQWWTKPDRMRFDALSAGLVQQFANYRPYPDLPVDGRLTLSENIADLGGLQAAFDAYRRTLGNKADDKRYVRQQDRQFFLGFAQAWRAKARENAVRKQVLSNDHAPENFRVATVRNLDAWYDAFDVVPGQRLYLDPKFRVRIW
jgi:endothelin-converting enzyme/putative endopeptidase